MVGENPLRCLSLSFSLWAPVVKRKRNGATSFASLLMFFNVLVSFLERKIPIKVIELGVHSEDWTWIFSVDHKHTHEFRYFASDSEWPLDSYYVLVHALFLRGVNLLLHRPLAGTDREAPRTKKRKRLWIETRKERIINARAGTPNIPTSRGKSCFFFSFWNDALRFLVGDEGQKVVQQKSQLLRLGNYYIALLAPSARNSKYQSNLGGNWEWVKKNLFRKVIDLRKKGNEGEVKVQFHFCSISISGEWLISAAAAAKAAAKKLDHK